MNSALKQVKIRKADERGHGWLRISLRVLEFNGALLSTGDSASTETPGTPAFIATAPTETFLFDLG